MPRGTPLPIEDHLRRLRAYEETGCDRAAAEWLGMDVNQYTWWRQWHKLPTKPRPKEPKTRTLHMSAQKYLCDAVKEAAEDAGVTVSFFFRAIVIDWHTKQRDKPDA